MGFVAVVCVLVLLAGAAPSSDGAMRGEQQGMAMWSGDKGNQDGACGYGDNVGKNVPFMDLVAGFRIDTRDCGMCYRIICTSDPACSEQGVRVTVTDSCRAAECARGASVLDLTAYAFGSMAKPGLADDLRRVGLVAVREDCYYSPLPPEIDFPAFRVDPAATSEDFALTVVYVPGLGNSLYVTVQLKNAGEDTWHPMQFVEGHAGEKNKWKLFPENLSKVIAPMSISVTVPLFSRKSLKTVAIDVIPVGWKPGETYYRHTPSAA